jgi:hypothetical protein
MINPNVNSIIYQSQIYYRDLLNSLVVSKKLGKARKSDWDKCDLILGYLEALAYYPLLTDEEDIKNVNHILECLIKKCELNQFPVASPLTLQSVPTILVGIPGADGKQGVKGDRGPAGFAVDFSKLNVTIGSVVADTFLITEGKAARWDYIVVSTTGLQRASSIIGHWKADGTALEMVDDGAEDIGGNTTGIEFDLVYSGGSIQLIANVTSGTWDIIGTRYFIPNGGNSSPSLLGNIVISNPKDGDVLTRYNGYWTNRPDNSIINAIIFG